MLYYCNQILSYSSHKPLLRAVLLKLTQLSLCNVRYVSDDLIMELGRCGLSSFPWILLHFPSFTINSLPICVVFGIIHSLVILYFIWLN